MEAGECHYRIVNVVSKDVLYCSPVIHMAIHTLSVTFTMHYPLPSVCACATCVW